MSACANVTERDVVLRERAAVNAAIEWVFAEARRHYGINGGIEGVDARKYVEQRHPLPKITRPRVVKDPDHPFEWAVIGGALRVRNPVAESKFDVRSWGRANGDDFGAFEPTAARVKIWADLLAQPTETVDA